jgi:hypothetical protein
MIRNMPRPLPSRLYSPPVALVPRPLLPTMAAVLAVRRHSLQLLLPVDQASATTTAVVAVAVVVVDAAVVTTSTLATPTTPLAVPRHGLQALKAQVWFW